MQFRIMARGKGRRKGTSTKKKVPNDGVAEEEITQESCTKESEQTNSRKEDDIEKHNKQQQLLQENGNDGEANKNSVKRVYPRVFKYKDEELDMLCEWEECNYRTENLLEFVKHVEHHIPQLRVKVNDDGKAAYVCLWEECDFETEDNKEIIRHVNYHAFHTKIKCIGKNICNRTGVPACNYHELGRNIVPDIPNCYRCNWEDCTSVFQNAQRFFFHVEAHVRGYPSGNNIKGGLPCCWGSCKASFPSQHKVRDHVRTHTQEKMVGCPVCGGIFATRAKYYDHCKRQIPLEMHGYQCSHCFKFYPSERLLKGHMRLHVNHYKCPFCDMTCPGPASLSKHIRFRHLDDRPFKCSACDFRGKTQNDLSCHHRVHLPDGFFKCNEEGCEYSSRSPASLSWHYRKVHGNQVDPMYCCHICDARYFRGFLLTRHLVNKHSFQWPSGHSRFRYKLHEDGLYRLETVRYESLEVTQKMMQEKETSQSGQKRSRYGWQQRRYGEINDVEYEDYVDDPDENSDSGGQEAKKRKVRPYSPMKLRSPRKLQDQDECNGSEKEGKLIEIAVEELDEKGQVVKLEFIHTKEVRVTTDQNIVL
ncbi:hypothetical protein J437_LFUL000573 [Ladona fulva]|uniref:C2H2-type domain-containing protein n=1 Tax=Ladona fulva TaxID=123851 RepID=A0A8K0JUY8_LADFU|nr:hypothetical protein J437_LFUL000573 [Ladona fulva]